MKRNCRIFFLLSLLLLFSIPLMAGDGSASIAVGFGTNHNSASGRGVDTDTGYECDLGSSDTCIAQPGLSNFFFGFSGDGMPWGNAGFGFQAITLPTKADFGPMKLRQTFYDFNGIYAPIRSSDATLKLMAGIGGSKTSFTLDVTSCYAGGACVRNTYDLGSTNHFQFHAGVGLEINLTPIFFLRPQYDFRYVPNFTEQFGRNTVHGGMVWVGLKTAGR